MSTRLNDVGQDSLDRDEIVLPIVEEEVRLDTREVVTGRVRVRTLTETKDERVRHDLQGERLEVERVAVDRYVEAGAEPPLPRVEGDVTIIPVLEEVLVVEKRLLIKEELRITRHATRETVDTPVTVRRQRAVVERADGEGPFSTNHTPTEET